MNKIKMKNYIVLVSCLFLFNSCEDELEQSPFEELVTEDFFQTPSDFSTAINGVYAKMLEDNPGDDYYGSGFLGRPDILSDNVILAQTGRRSQEFIYDYRYDASQGWIGLWTDAYEVIFGANQILFFLNRLSEGEFRDNIEGQALALRANAHFDLVRTFAKIPTQSSDANSSLGIPYVTEGDPTVAPFIEPSRESVDAVYTKIIEDLQSARDLVAATTDPEFIDKDAVNALLSRVYLYQGDYERVIASANAVETDVAQRGNFADIWTDASDDGVIFKLGANSSINIGVEWSQSASGNTISEYAVDFALVQLYQDNDVRKDAYIFRGTNDGQNYNAIKKYLGEPGQVNGEVDPKVIRAAEVLLNKAEALANLDRDGEALATLDELRSERYIGFVSGGETGDTLKQAIQLERRLELAFESHRFFDIKRMGESITRSDFGDLIDGTGTEAEIKTLESGNFRFQFPIPQDELNANPNIEQNPGYE